MNETKTTSNGYRIENPAPEMDAVGFQQHMASEYGFDGGTSESRVERLKTMSVEGVAILIEDINKSVQGSQDSLINHERAMKIKTKDGKEETIPLKDRYAVFLELINGIRSSPDTINPRRVGDVLALGVVLLHPFEDGNGRTARALGLLFSEHYDSIEDYGDTYRAVIESGDAVRKRGGMKVMSYVPRMPEGTSQSNAEDVSKYLHDLLHEEMDGAYVGPFGEASLAA